MKFVDHRKGVVANIRHKIFQLVKVRNYVEEDTALTIYKSMILPSFDYVDYVWDRDNKGENRELQLLQNKGLRSVYKVKLGKDPRYNTDQLHAEGKCMLLADRRDLHLLAYAHSLACLDRYIDKRQLPTRRMAGKRLIVPHTLKPIVLRSAFYRSIMIWNRLKPVFTEIEDLKKFKLSIKKNYPNIFM